MQNPGFIMLHYYTKFTKILAMLKNLAEKHFRENVKN